MNECILLVFATTASLKCPSVKRLAAKPGEIQQVSDLIYRITLNQPFYAPNQVYLVRDEKTFLIDSGYAESIGSLGLALRQLGLSLRSIDTIVYTHPHIDHITAGLLWPAYSSRTERWGHYRMAEDIPDYPEFLDVWQADTARVLTLAFQDKQARNARIRRANERWAKFVRRFSDSEHKLGDRAVKLDRLLREGDEFSTGKLRFRIIETPGHNTWHITPVEISQGFAFTGDLLIGNIPAIYDSLDGNLELFQDSLQRLIDLRKSYPTMRFLPAHGDEIANPERTIRVVLKTIGILENGILKKLHEGRKDLVALLESAFGTQVEGGNHFITALELLEALLRKLMREGKVKSEVFDEGYEVFGIAN